MQLERHRCYIQPETKKKKKPTPEEGEEEEMPENGYDVSAFFDTKCRQGEREPEDEPVEESLRELLFFYFECRKENGNHEPNLCVVQDKAGKEWIFKGDKTRDEFCEWLFTTEHTGCTVMAHNFQGYDSYFNLQYLREHGVKYDVIMRGAKVLSLTVDMFNIRFVDSLNFIPMKLANFPKTFGIEELEKGHFPHLFNRKENENYVGPIPPAPYYNPNGMNPKEREAFMTWHASKKESNYVFNLQEEILAYCRSDVDILRRCCLEFRKLFHDVTDIDPFRTLTIASACHIAPTTFLKIRSPSFHRWDIALRTINRCLPINGCRTRPKRTKFVFNTRITAARNVLAPICSTGTIKKPIPRMNFTAVSGTDVPDVTPAIQ